MGRDDRRSWDNWCQMTITGDTPTQLLSITEAARLLRVSKTTAYRLVSSGALPALRVGHAIRIDALELERYLYEKGTPA